MRDSMKQLEKMRRIIQKICVLLDLVAAVLVLVAILLSIASIVRDVSVFQRLLTDTSEFKRYLEQIFMLVIGIEFLGMLCRPSSENVIEVLIFLVARHMIVGDTTPYQDFVSVISVALLCVVRHHLAIIYVSDCSSYALHYPRISARYVEVTQYLTNQLAKFAF